MIGGEQSEELEKQSRKERGQQEMIQTGTGKRKR